MGFGIENTFKLKIQSIRIDSICLGLKSKELVPPIVYDLAKYLLNFKYDDQGNSLSQGDKFILAVKEFGRLKTIHNDPHFETFFDFVWYYRNNYPEHQRRAIDRTFLGPITYEYDSDFKEKLDGKSFFLYIHGHETPDLDSIVSSTIEAYKCLQERSMYNVRIKPTYFGDIGVDIVGLSDEVFGEGFFHSFFAYKDDYRMAAKHIAKPASSYPEITMSSKFSDVYSIYEGLAGDYSIIPIVDEDGKYLGCIRAGDSFDSYVNQCIDEGANFSEMTMADVLAWKNERGSHFDRAPLLAGETLTREVKQDIVAYGSIPVVDENGKFFGVVDEDSLQMATMYVSLLDTQSPHPTFPMEQRKNIASKDHHDRKGGNTQYTGSATTQVVKQLLDSRRPVKWPKPLILWGIIGIYDDTDKLNMKKLRADDIYVFNKLISMYADMPQSQKISVKEISDIVVGGSVIGQSRAQALMDRFEEEWIVEDGSLVFERFFNDEARFISEIISTIDELGFDKDQRSLIMKAVAAKIKDFVIAKAEITKQINQGLLVPHQQSKQRYLHKEKPYDVFTADFKVYETNEVGKIHMSQEKLTLETLREYDLFESAKKYGDFFGGRDVRNAMHAVSLEGIGDNSEGKHKDYMFITSPDLKSLKIMVDKVVNKMKKQDDTVYIATVPKSEFVSTYGDNPDLLNDLFVNPSEDSLVFRSDALYRIENRVMDAKAKRDLINLYKAIEDADDISYALIYENKQNNGIPLVFTTMKHEIDFILSRKDLRRCFKFDEAETTLTLKKNITIDELAHLIDVLAHADGGVYSGLAYHVRESFTNVVLVSFAHEGVTFSRKLQMVPLYDLVE